MKKEKFVGKMLTEKQTFKKQKLVNFTNFFSQKMSVSLFSKFWTSSICT